jgi:hypothetical protein
MRYTSKPVEAAMVLSSGPMKRTEPLAVPLMATPPVNLTRSVALMDMAEGSLPADTVSEPVY